MDAASLATALLAEGADVETVLRRLRADGFSPMDAVKALRTGDGMSLREADLAVLRSETWADRHDELSELRELFWAEAAEHADAIETTPDGHVSASFDLTKCPDSR